MARLFEKWLSPDSSGGGKRATGTPRFEQSGAHLPALISAAANTPRQSHLQRYCSMVTQFPTANAGLSGHTAVAARGESGSAL